jgi:hypothetical protein
MAEFIRATEYKLRSARAAADPSSDKYNQSSWAILYGALAESFGLTPETFQLVYPGIVWNWPDENLGYIGPAAYDAMSTIPQYSAVGSYTSSGERFNDQYLAFLNVIDPATSDPKLRGDIERAYNAFVAAANTYDRTMQQAKASYDGLVDGGTPSFTGWLGTLQGRGWQAKIESGFKGVESAQRVYNSLVDQTVTPNLTEALNAYADEDYWSTLNDLNLKAMPAVPGYATPITSSVWRDRMERGEVPSNSISLANSDQSFDYSKSWAKGSASVGSWFWRVKVSSKWERIDAFASDASLSATITFKGIEQVGIQPSGWYKGVKNLANGPYKRGFSKDGEGGTTAVFGDKGFLPMVKTGMLVAAGLTFDISVDKSTFNYFSQMFEAATSIGIGPFTLDAEGGHKTNNWQADSESTSFSGTSSSTQPQIVGWTINTLP